MKVMSDLEQTVSVCRLQRFWAVRASHNGEALTLSQEGVAGHLSLAAPWIWELTRDERIVFEVSGGITLFFDSLEEASRVYLQTVGPSGPTVDNGYDGPLRVTAYLISPEVGVHTYNF